MFFSVFMNQNYIGETNKFELKKDIKNYILYSKIHYSYAFSQELFKDTSLNFYSNDGSLLEYDIYGYPLNINKNDDFIEIFFIIKEIYIGKNGEHKIKVFDLLKKKELTQKTKSKKVIETKRTIIL